MRHMPQVAPFFERVNMIRMIKMRRKMNYIARETWLKNQAVLYSSLHSFGNLLYWRRSK
jgi:hypothetical protein